jgi:CheY-like chemotaxis protein
MSAKVLLVDDDLSVRQSLGYALQSEHYTVVAAASGQEALEILCRSEVDLVLLDINMPGLNGWETIDQIIQINPFLPVIIITARPGQRQAAAQAGAAAVLEKPMLLPALLDLMKSLMAEPLELRRQRLASRETLAAGGERKEFETAGSCSMTKKLP